MALENGLIALAAATAIGVSALASAWAESKIGTAAMGALAENEDLFGKALVFLVIPETIVIFGLVIAILVIGMA